MSSRLRNPVRNGIIVFLLVAALCWVIFVVPFFLLGNGMSGATVADGIRFSVENAAAGDALSVAMIALTLCLLGLPWALWVLVKER